MSDAIDSTAVEVGAELVPSEAPAPTTLLRTDDPVEVIEKATRVADALKRVLVERKMIQPIQGKDHVKVEGWVTLGAMLGVVPVVVWTRKLDRGWEARVEARTLNGNIVGAAEAECLRDENRWSKADDYAIRSMAQTRATSKALGGPLRFIITLAGYEGTPAEEMPREGYGNPGRTTSGVTASAPQIKLIKRLVTESKPTAAQMEALLERAGAVGVKFEAGWTDKLTGGGGGTASALITLLKDEPLPDVGNPSDVPTPAAEDFKQAEGVPTEDVPF